MAMTSMSHYGDIGKSMKEIRAMGKVMREMTTVKRMNFKNADK
jgi:hypothetical protein